MKNKLLFSLVSLLVLLSLIGTSCTTETTPTPAATTTSPTSTPAATAAANWWDDQGEPVYGGELNIFRQGWEVSWDPDYPIGSSQAMYLESLFAPDWTVNPDTWSFNTAFIPEEYTTGLLAESWEWTDTQTITVKLKEGIHWQNKAPVNGREFTADDVVYSYDRMLGTGNGFTEPNAFWGGALSSIQKVVKIDDYTVEFQLKKPGATAIYQLLEGKVYIVSPIVAREWVEQGDSANWENGVGTGPWFVSDVVENTSITYSANPDYWGTDERHPENQIPYFDTMKCVVISDTTTAISAMRTNQIDMMAWDRAGTLTLQQADTLAKSNPEFQQGSYPGGGFTLEMRCDLEPFTDIRVRKALNMAVDRDLIAENYYMGYVDGKPSGVVAPQLTDYAYTYDEWTEDLKEGYSYNPEKAMELLAEAGFPNGFETTSVMASGPDVPLMEIIKAMLSDIGVDCTIEVMDAATARTYTMAKNHDGVAVSGRMSMPFSPMEAIQIRMSGNRNCLLFHNDTNYDGMVNAVESATTMDEAKQLIKAADKYNLEQYWSVYVCPTVIPIIWQPYLKGYTGMHTNMGYDGFLYSRLWIEE